MTFVDEQRYLGNFILDSLSQEEYNEIHPDLKWVKLLQGEILVEARTPITHVYFPVTAVVSWIDSTLEGESVEIGITGFEGIVGATLLFEENAPPWAVEVQLTGAALQMDAQLFANALQQFPGLRQKVGKFAYQKMLQLTRSGLCNRFHSVEQRLCRWLLAAQDRTNTQELLLTREILATMIGSSRSVVSIATGTLQSAGLIRAVRGKITILNREEMEETACECYHVVKQQFDHYLQS
ncbi:MAG: Crp/Fnr family transcriptional regulator [Leptolyngbyaceae cyanobacterium bins.349]|nr:Crp/Fnr family transcriptional regulator [Leptolyngbyaceae cyanobacterium bins.349]